MALCQDIRYIQQFGSKGEHNHQIQLDQRFFPPIILFQTVSDSRSSETMRIISVFFFSLEEFFEAHLNLQTLQHPLVNCILYNIFQQLNYNSLHFLYCENSAQVFLIPSSLKFIISLTFSTLFSWPSFLKLRSLSPYNLSL